MDATGQPLSVWAAEDGICVTSVFDIRLGGDAPPLRQAKANARLMAAAPELLAALVALVDEFGCTIDQYHKNGPDWTHKDGTEVFDVSTVLDRAPLIDAARAAIAKAKGGSS